jgi:hypothetical protein
MCLKNMWDANIDFHGELLEIVFMLYLVKLRGLVFRTIILVCIILVTNFLPIHLETYLCYDALYLLW